MRSPCAGGDGGAMQMPCAGGGSGAMQMPCAGGDSGAMQMPCAGGGKGPPGPLHPRPMGVCPLEPQNDAVV
jgi:hypothetical protein